MKVLEKATMPNGTEIQLEDWSEHNTKEYPNLYGFEICAYPVAKNTGKYRWVEGGQKFRLSIASNLYMNYTDDDVKKDYAMLKSGEKKLQDLADHFWNREKDAWYLGMDVENRNY